MIHPATGNVYFKCPYDIRMFISDEEYDYRLTKVKAKDMDSLVFEGQSLKGSVTIIDLNGEPGIRVQGKGFSYLQTSPIVKVTDKSDNFVTFETLGGFYKLEKC